MHADAASFSLMSLENTEKFYESLIFYDNVALYNFIFL